MVPKQKLVGDLDYNRFRAVLFRMVPKLLNLAVSPFKVLELCCFEWFQNNISKYREQRTVLELCCFEWFQNRYLLTSYRFLSFRAVLFRMVPKHAAGISDKERSFRAVLFRMVPSMWDT